MSQNDHSIANANGATVRADINSSLQALASNNGGATAPSTTYANEWWFDTANDILKIRDEANANWVDVASLVGTTWIPYSNGAVLGTIANLAYTAINQNLTMSAKHVAFATTAVSSGTPDFAASGNVVSLSGTATANTLGTVQAGFIGFIHYGISIALTYNATSRILQSAANITTAVGDCEIVLSLGSGNWRTIGYIRASGAALVTGAPLSKTASYTATDADNGAVIRFSGLAADATLTLPAASGRNGFRLTVSNEDTSDWGVIVDPNSTEQLDGFTSRKTYPGSRVTFVCDGTGWRTASGPWRFFSGDQTIGAGTQPTIAHGLGVRPRRVWLELKCTTAEFNYSIGDIILYGSVGVGAGPGTWFNPIVDATNVTLVMGATGTPAILNKNTSAAASLTATRWKVRVYAEE